MCASANQTKVRSIQMRLLPSLCVFDEASFAENRGCEGAEFNEAPGNCYCVGRSGMIVSGEQCTEKQPCPATKPSPAP